MEEILHLFKYDPESPTFLINTINRPPNARKGEPAGTIASHGLQVGVKGKTYRNSRIVWELHHGPIPEGMLIKFKDGNMFNCAIENLELQNQRIKSLASERPLGITGKRGVTMQNGRFRTSVKMDGGTIHLGMYGDLDSAVTARRKGLHLLEKIYESKSKTP